MRLANRTKLITEITNHHAPTTKGNLWYEVTIFGNFAKVDCGLEEHAGSHKNRHVTFRASEDCTVSFENSDVFGYSDLLLKKGKPKELAIADGTNNVETRFSFDVDTTTTKPVDDLSDVAFKAEPKLFVP